ncbi:GNAT family N-acetyltransferase [Ideonella sp. YS5]|uniref:GNAT family N-acetyltransferase n=1 Tax=Ideonella sp. YS5 TaxID=3453714 RepID=UPI003EEDCA32
MPGIPTPLLFETLQEHHAVALHDALLDPRLYPFIPEKPPRSLERLQAAFREFHAGAPAGSGEVWLNWVIRERSANACIGTLQATRFASGELWVGYKIVPAWWGRGVGTDGLRWLLDELQARYPGVPVLASVDTRNLASVRVLEKCGFERLRREGAELHGEITEDFIYRLSRPSGDAVP